MRVAKSTAASLTIDVRNEDGDLSTPTGSVAVVVKDSAGSTVQSGNAVVSATAGCYTFALGSAVTGTLGEYTATASWTLSGVAQSRTEAINVVNEHLFEIHELRAYDPSFSDATRYTADDIRKARDTASQRLERAAGVAFSAQRKSVTLSGDGTTRLLVPDVMVTSVVSVTVDGTAVDASTVKSEAHGALIRSGGDIWPATAPNNIVVVYEHGYASVLGDVRKGAMAVAREHLVPSATPARATSQSTDLGEFRISVANLELGRPTGIPEVDTVIALYGQKRPAVG
jgi:hypothetical protein